MIKTYSRLLDFLTFEEKYNYLKLNGQVGVDTFGFDRMFNQKFYKSAEWKRVRDHVIVRDNGDDLGVSGYPIVGKIIVHHMNPIKLSDIQEVNEYLLDPEYLISTTLDTHNAIHYGDAQLLSKNPIDRVRNDTCPWIK